MPTEEDIGKVMYLGDGVYVKFDGYHLVLMANSHDNPTDKVYLDDCALLALLSYAKRISFAGLEEE